MSAVEITVAERWIYSVLAADGALTAAAPGGIHSELAPAGTAYPFVVFQWMGADDVYGTGATRIMVRPLYLVKAVGTGTSKIALETAARRVDALLHQKSNITLATGEVLASHREAPFSLATLENGIQYRHLGGLYRLYIQQGA